MPDATHRPLKVFLCHASQDKPKVRELYQRLKAEGWIDPWLDVNKILPGQHWTSVIRQSLADADAIIILISCTSTGKEGFIQREMNYAWDLSLEKPRSVIYLIPLRLEECDVPYDLRERQWADYFGEKQEETYKALLQSLKMRHDQVLRLEADQNARREREERERKATEELSLKKDEEKTRFEAEERARKVAEEQAKEKESQGKKAAEELKRKQAEDHARLAKEARERKAAAEQAWKEAEKIQPEKVVVQPVEQKNHPARLTKRPARKINYIPFGIGAIVLLVLTCGISGVNYVIKHWPAAFAPAATVTPTGSSSATLTYTPARTFTPKPPTATPTPKPGSTQVSGKDGMVMVYVPEGSFSMGSNSYSDEHIHSVYLDAFWIDQTEVTTKMYGLCVTAGQCDSPGSSASYTRQDYYGNPDYDDFPVIYVSWNDASAYCAWRGNGTRLPTEAEWEKAARGMDGRTYPWGEDIDCNKANYSGESKYCVGDTTAVGSYPSGASPYGALDMAGNVWEWVADWYSDTYYASSPSDNPTGPSSGDYRVLRGGAWSSYDSFARSALRYRNFPSFTINLIGFRCSRSP